MSQVAKLISVLVTLLILSACALFPQPVNVGDTEEQVIAARGTPTHRYRIGDEELLEYMHGPFGQTTEMARFSPDGKLISFEQVLTDEKFASLTIGSSRKIDVLHTVGAPSEETYFPISRLEAWTYPYLQYGIWDSLMHVYFDQSGVVRKMEVTPDFRYRRELQGDGNHR